MRRPSKADRERNAAFLIAVGAAMAFLCGTCTGAILSGRGDEYGLRQLAWVVGGIPTGFGVLLMGLGVYELRQVRRDDRP